MFNICQGNGKDWRELVADRIGNTNDKFRDHLKRTLPFSCSRQILKNAGRQKRQKILSTMDGRRRSRRNADRSAKARQAVSN